MGKLVCWVSVHLNATRKKQWCSFQSVQVQPPLATETSITTITGDLGDWRTIGNNEIQDIPEPSRVTAMTGVSFTCVLWWAKIQTVVVPNGQSLVQFRRQRFTYLLSEKPTQNIIEKSRCSVARSLVLKELVSSLIWQRPK